MAIVFLSDPMRPLRKNKLFSTNKYGNKISEYNGQKFHSKKEMAYAEQLDFEIRLGKIKGWEPQVRIPLFVNGDKICVYILDFKVTHLDGSIEWVEIKGMWTDVAKLKVKLFRAIYLKEHPGERYTIIE